MTPRAKGETSENGLLFSSVAGETQEASPGLGGFIRLRSAARVEIDDRPAQGATYGARLPTMYTAIKPGLLWDS